MKSKTFTEMKQVFDEYNTGLLTFAEVIQRVQCNEVQLDLLIEYNKLPIWAQRKIKLVELDTEAAKIEDGDWGESKPLEMLSKSAKAKSKR